MPEEGDGRRCWGKVTRPKVDVAALALDDLCVYWDTAARQYLPLT